MHYTPGKNPMEPLDLSVGDRIRLDGKRMTWEIRAVSKHFAVAVQNTKHGPAYTVLDWRNGVRGPCDLIGQGYGDGTYSREQCSEMLEGFEYDFEKDPSYQEAKRKAQEEGKNSWSWQPKHFQLNVSHRNWVKLAPDTISVVQSNDELKKARDRNRQRKYRASLTPEERSERRREADKRYRENHRDERREADRKRWADRNGK